MQNNSKQLCYLFWRSRPYPPILMTLALKASVFGLKKIFPRSRLGWGALSWQNSENFYIYRDQELKRTVDALLKLALKRPAVFFNFLKVAYQKARHFNLTGQKLSFKKVKKAGLPELIAWQKKYSATFFDFYSYGGITSLAGYRQDNLLYEKMNEILRRKTRSNPEKFADYLLNLTKPPKLLKTDNQELALLELAKKAKKLNLKTAAEIMSKLKKPLNRIYEEYKYLSFDFTDKFEWDLIHYARFTADRVKININAKIKEIKNYERKTSVDFNRLTRELKLSAKEKQVFNLVRNLGYYKWLREHEFQEGCAHYKLISDELGRRFGLTAKEALYVLPPEWEEYEQRKEKLKQLVAQRIKFSLFLTEAGKPDLFLTGQEAKKEFAKLKFAKEKSCQTAGKIKGTPAFSGFSSGRVKIINTAKDLPKMKPGDILVSVATSPALLFAMKKAAAIITDEGGITCHAAIVSRELKIPCIIGVKIATKILKDGDRVEVDANKGVVRKL